MSTPKKWIHFTADIAAPVATVYDTTIGLESYKQWTSAFSEGSYYEGSWDTGQPIRFLGPEGGGMVAEIAENRRNAFISIRHLGFIANGVDDTTSEAVRAWVPAYENYTYEATPQGTRLTIDQEVTAEFEAYMADAWPKALAKLKAIAQAAAAAGKTRP